MFMAGAYEDENRKPFEFAFAVLLLITAAIMGATRGLWLIVTGRGQSL